MNERGVQRICKVPLDIGQVDRGKVKSNLVLSQRSIKLSNNKTNPELGKERIYLKRLLQEGECSDHKIHRHLKIEEEKWFFCFLFLFLNREG